MTLMEQVEDAHRRLDWTRSAVIRHFLQEARLAAVLGDTERVAHCIVDAEHVQALRDRRKGG